MAELDPLIAEILLKGDEEFIGAIKKVGTEAAEGFEKLAAAAEKGASSFKVTTGALALIEAALAGVTAATVLFVEEQTELSQKTILLANAFGTTAGQLQELETIFASSGVKVDQFERFANRLTITIARQWPAIAESIKTYALENDAATLRVSSAILNVREAQNKLADNSSQRASQMVHDNEALEGAYIKLSFSAQKAASEQRGAFLAVQSAQQSVTAAEQKLAELEGRPPSAAEKQNLALAQAQTAVESARKAATDARIAQQEKAAEADLKRRQAESAYDDLARKAAQNARDDAAQRTKDENAVRAAVIARGEAEEKASKLSLTNIASIRSALDGIVAGDKAAASAVTLTSVSVQNLTKAIIAQAAEHSKAVQPTGYETLIQLSRTLTSATNEQITQEQKLALVNSLAGTSMQALGASAAEILHVLEHSSGELAKFSGIAKALDTHEAKEAIEQFRGALAGLNLTMSILSQRFAIAVSPTFTLFLRAIQQSLESNTGLLHGFISGITGLASALVTLGGYLGTTIDYFTRLFSGGLLSGADLLKAALIGIGVAITVATGPIGIMIVAIGALITAIGLVRDNWDSIVASVNKAWAAVKDNVVVKFLTDVLDLLLKIGAAILAFDRLTSIKLPAATAAAGGAPETAVEHHAEGGHITGPGTGTSDSILSRLSNGEFVVKARAVANYGTGLFHALNNMELPGFAAGGLVSAPVRMAGNGNVPATSTLNLSIDGKSFNGLRGPKSTIDDLSSFAISRQASATGSNPEWMK